MKDEKERAFAYAQNKADRNGIGYYVYLEKRKNKRGTVIERLYHVVREDFTQPNDLELQGYRAPTD